MPARCARRLILPAARSRRGERGCRRFPLLYRIRSQHESGNLQTHAPVADDDDGLTVMADNLALKAGRHTLHDSHSAADRELLALQLQPGFPPASPVLGGAKLG